MAAYFTFNTIRHEDTGKRLRKAADFSESTGGARRRVIHGGNLDPSSSSRTFVWSCKLSGTWGIGEKEHRQ